MSVGTILARVFTADTLACSHCGSSEIYPYAGLYGELGGLLGRVRYACRSCRRNSWLSPDADTPPGTQEEHGLEVARSLPARTRAALDGLDLEVEPILVEPTRTDLRALDAELAQGRTRRGRRKNH